MSPRADGLVRDRDGELIEPKPIHDCQRGWLPGPDGLVPCPVCRPDTCTRVREQRERAQARREGTYADPRPTEEETHPMPEPTTEKGPHTVRATLTVALAVEDRDVIVTELRSRASDILAAAPTDAASIVDSPRDGGKDHRTKALHLAQRLAHAGHLQHLADQLDTAQTA